MQCITEWSGIKTPLLQSHALRKASRSEDKWQVGESTSFESIWNII